MFFCLGSSCDNLMSYSVRDIFWPLKQTDVCLPTIFIENSSVTNNPVFTQGITGNRSAINFTSSLKQYFVIDYGYDFRNRSFTISLWLYYIKPADFYHMIFASCSQTNWTQCLGLYIVNDWAVFNFFDVPTVRTVSLNNNSWYHIAGIYDITTGNRSIYLNGIKNSEQNVTMYEGNITNITIGWASHMINSYLNGLMDRLSLINQAMSADEVLQEATLTAYYSFNTSIEQDSGPNRLHGSGYNVNLTNSSLGDHALRFSNNSNGSYFQAENFLLLGFSNYSFSISFWILPIQSERNSSVLFMSWSNGGCLPIIGLNSSGTINAQVENRSQEIVNIARFISFNYWALITLTYDTDNLTLYANDQLVQTISQVDYEGHGSPVTLTLGYSPTLIDCSSPHIIPGPFEGYIDEFRVYSRCLTSGEITAMYNAYPESGE